MINIRYYVFMFQMILSLIHFIRYHSDSHERKEVLEVLSTKAVNPLVFFGDSHDAWAFKMDDEGGMTGNPVAPNIGTPAVTSQGINAALALLVPGVWGALNQGGLQYEYQDIQDKLNSLIQDTNVNQVYGNIWYNGFIIVTVTHEKTTTEFIGLNEGTIKQDYSTARAANSDGITAGYQCMASFVTTAGVQGSLDEQEGCITTFMPDRPGYWESTKKTKKPRL